VLLLLLLVAVLLSGCVCKAWEVQELALMMSWCMT